MSGLRVDIRTATAEDVALLTELGRRTFRDTFAEDNTEADMAAYLATAFSEEIQGRELADSASAFLIAQVADRVAGYARIRLGPAPAYLAADRPIEIVRFYADAPWIGRGVGSALMTACLGEAAARGCDVAWLAVWERNPRAIAFYSKWGFEPVGTQDFLVGDDVQHDVVMARQVAGAAVSRVGASG